MKDTFTMLFVKAKHCEQRNEKYFYYAFHKKLKNFVKLFSKAKKNALTTRRSVLFIYAYF